MNTDRCKSRISPSNVDQTTSEGGGLLKKKKDNQITFIIVKLKMKKCLLRTDLLATLLDSRVRSCVTDCASFLQSLI